MDIRHRRLRLIVIAAIVAVLGISTFAQRGGGFNRRRTTYVPGPEYNIAYDGKFTFVRMSYPTYGRREAKWLHDYPIGEQNFMTIFSTITNAPSHVEGSNILSFGDPEMFKYPVIYLCEPGDWELSAEEAVNLHDYLAKGGFMIVDDFPYQAWRNFDLQMSRAFPTAQWIELDAAHPMFHSFFEIDPLTVHQSYMGGRPQFFGLFEDNDPTKRLLVVANYNNDLSEYWEASTTGYSVVAPSNEAYKIGVNQFIYAITH